MRLYKYATVDAPQTRIAGHNRWKAGEVLPYVHMHLTPGLRMVNVVSRGAAGLAAEVRRTASRVAMQWS